MDMSHTPILIFSYITHSNMKVYEIDLFLNKMFIHVTLYTLNIVAFWYIPYCQLYIAHSVCYQALYRYFKRIDNIPYPYYLKYESGIQIGLDNLYVFGFSACMGERDGWGWGFMSCHGALTICSNILIRCAFIIIVGAELEGGLERILI